MTRDPQTSTTSSESWTRLVETRLQRLRYGVITLTVHDGRIVQVDCTERTRLTSSRSPGPEEDRPNGR